MDLSTSSPKQTDRHASIALQHSSRSFAGELARLPSVSCSFSGLAAVHFQSLVPPELPPRVTRFRGYFYGSKFRQAAGSFGALASSSFCFCFRFLTTLTCSDNFAKTNKKEGPVFAAQPSWRAGMSPHGLSPQLQLALRLSETFASLHGRTKQRTRQPSTSGDGKPTIRTVLPSRHPSVRCELSQATSVPVPGKPLGKLPSLTLGKLQSDPDGHCIASISGYSAGFGSDLIRVCWRICVMKRPTFVSP